jgi:outer membrane receptor protein involved in Fe transport
MSPKAKSLRSASAIALVVLGCFQVSATAIAQSEAPALNEPPKDESVDTTKESSGAQSETPGGTSAPQPDAAVPADDNTQSEKAGTADTSSGSQAAELEEVVVTAQKRTERLQDVPISVSVVSGDTLKSSGVATLRELSSTIPDVYVVKAGPSDRLFIRGIGSGDNFSFDQSVATFVDGIYHGRSRSSGAGFLDIDRIELLKGPQSVYFGNSAIGGAINVTTRRPTDTFTGDFSTAYNFDWKEIALDGAVGGPLTNTLSGRLAANFSSGDGWLYDSGWGEHVPQTNNKAIRGQLNWKPSENLDVNLKAEAGRFRQDGGILIQLTSCPPPEPFPGPAGFCPAVIAAGEETELDNNRASTPGQHSYLNNEEYVLSTDYSLGGATLTVLTGYLTHRLNSPNDPDGPTVANLFAVAVPERYQQFSQELRVTSKKGGMFDYIAGVYYQHDRLRTEQDITYGFLTPSVTSNPNFAELVPYLPLGQVFAFGQAEDIYSAFGSLTFHVTDSFRVIGGVRGTIVSKDADKSIYFGTGHSFEPGVTPFPESVLALSQTLTNGIAPTVAARYFRTDRHVSPSVNLQYDLARDVLAYASYAHGFKAGGFNGQDASPDQEAVPYGPEKVDAVELGLKTQFFNRRMTLNTALFRSEYDDLQVGGARPFVTSPAATVQNAGGARSQGIELEQRWAITRSLTSSLSVVLLDAKYTSYPNANPTSLQTVQGIPRQDLSGARTPYSPKYSGTWRLDYAIPLPRNLVFKLGGSMLFTDSYNLTTNNDPYLDQEAFVKFDGTIGLSDVAAGWDLSVLVRNLSDEDYLVYGAAAPRSLGSYSVQKDPPRNIAVQLRWRF